MSKETFETYVALFFDNIIAGVGAGANYEAAHTAAYKDARRALNDEELAGADGAECTLRLYECVCKHGTPDKWTENNFGELDLYPEDEY